MRYLTFLLLLLTVTQAAAVEVVSRFERNYRLPPMVVRDYTSLVYYVGIPLAVVLLFWAALKLRQAKARANDKAFREMISKDYESGPIV